MDALIYTLMSGAERSLRAQQLHANNLANIETNGFRADLELATSEAVTQGYGYDTRHMSRLEANAVSARVGAVRQTGRGAACHTGRKSCFYRRVTTRDGVATLEDTGLPRLFDPKDVYRK